MVFLFLHSSLLGLVVASSNAFIVIVVLLTRAFMSAAVAVNDQLTYAVVEIQPLAISEEDLQTPKVSKGKKVGAALENPQVKYVVVAADLVSTLQGKWGVTLAVKGTFPGSALEFCRSSFLS